MPRCTPGLMAHQAAARVRYEQDRNASETPVP
jgi:hypothetical protein